MADKKEREFVCAYNHCLHHGEKVKASESVVINNKHYHWDCAGMKQEIKDCVDAYIDCVEDKSSYGAAYRIINTMVFNNKIPIAFIRKNIETCKLYYKNKPVQVLYGLRKLFYEKEFKM